MTEDRPIAGDEEEIEGYHDQDADGASWEEYPIDDLLIRSDQRSVFEVVRRIRRDQYVMDPDFQRDFIWKLDKQSKLIESVLMRIPLPVFYLAENKAGKMIVVDGLQRLSTFTRFLHDELTLKLPDRPALDGKRFSDLHPRLQTRVEDCALRLYIIDSKVPDRARLDIFERVNGGEPLTRQQMRNCLYNGQATRFLKAEAATDLFVRATGKSLRTETMRDREFVNRFCAFQLLPIDDYKGQMDDFLAIALEKMNSGEVDLKTLSAQFRNALANNFAVFGKHAFRKHTRPDQGRSQLNASLWDILSTGLSRYSEREVVARSDALRATFYALMSDHDFMQSISYSPNSVKQVRHRFKVMRATLDTVFS